MIARQGPSGYLIGTCNLCGVTDEPLNVYRRTKERLCDNCTKRRDWMAKAPDSLKEDDKEYSRWLYLQSLQKK